jgi:hypothetical protein
MVIRRTQGGEEVRAGTEARSALPVPNLSLPEQHRKTIEPSNDGSTPSKGSDRSGEPGKPSQVIEAMHMIRKAQVRWLLKGDVGGQVLFINSALGLKTV